MIASECQSLKVQNEQQVYEAVVAARSGDATLADALICALAKSAGCTKTLTFDNRSQLADFEVV